MTYPAPMVFLAMVLALGSGCATAGAQSPLKGHVVDATTARPIAGAEVAVALLPSVFTDSSGAFVIPAPRSRNILLLVRKLGYVPRQIRPDPAKGDLANLVVALDHVESAQLLPTVTTTTESLVPLQYQFTHRYDDFFINKKSTIGGAFYTRAQIDSLGGVREAMEGTPGVRIRVDRFNRYRPTSVGCVYASQPLDLRINGRKATWDEFDDLPSDQIELLEVHRSALDAPGIDAGAACGVVWVFTK